MRRPPVRSCVACRTGRPQSELLRIVRSPAGAVALDAAGRAPGRGAYVCRDQSCIQNATGRGLLSRALESSIPASLAGELIAAVTPSTPPGGSLGQE